MVKTNIIKTKKIRKISIFFLFFFYKIRGPFWDTSINLFFFPQVKKKFHEYRNPFIKKIYLQL